METELVPEDEWMELEAAMQQAEQQYAQKQQACSPTTHKTSSHQSFTSNNNNNHHHAPHTIVNASNNNNRGSNSGIRTVNIKGKTVTLRKINDNSALYEYLCEGLDLVIVGDNPGVQSATSGHHYAHSTNHFWPLLYESGLIGERLTSNEDVRVMEYGIGLTCLCGRSSVSSSELSNKELNNGFEILQEKLQKFRPKLVCFNGKGIYESVTGVKCRIGLQPKKIVVSDGTSFPVYVMPSTSGRVTAHTREDKLQCLKEMKQIIQRL